MSEEAAYLSSEKKTVENEVERALLEERVRRRLAYEKKAHQIVERLLDNPITEELLLDCALSIYPRHYQDVVTERSIVKQCGYPLCQTSLHNVPKQKYHISRKTNKVYDITDRKCFCSQACYKASKFFEAQLSDTPLWTRDMEEPLDIKLLTQDTEDDSTATSLISKDNVVLTERIESRDVDEVGSGEKDTPLKEEVVGLLEDDLSNLTFADIRKKERLQQLAEIDGLPATSQAEPARTVKQNEPSGSSELEAANRSQEVHPPTVLSPGDSSKESPAEIKTEMDEDLRKEEQNMEQRCQENRAQLQSDDMPSGVPDDNDKPSSKVDREDASQDLQGVKKKKPKTKIKKPSAQIAREAPLLQTVSRTFSEWITNETHEFLMEGPSNKESDNATSANQRDSTLTYDPLAMASDLTIPLTEPLLPPAKPLPCMDKLKEETEQYSLKVEEFYLGRHLDIKKKEKKAKSEEEKQEEEGIDRTVRLPLVDSKSQMAIRRKILSDRLNRVYSDILTRLGLSMRDISTDLQSLIRTFTLSSTNITFKPAGWMMIGLLLLQILSKCNALIRDSLTKDDSRLFLDSLLVQMGTSLEELAHVVQTIIETGRPNTQP